MLKLSKTTFRTTNGGLSSTGNTSSPTQISWVRLTNVGDIDRQRVSDETVGRPYDLLRRRGLGDLFINSNSLADFIYGVIKLDL